MSARCPACRLYNPDSALRCDCGYEFDSRSNAAQAAAYATFHRIAGSKKMWIGAACSIVGGAVVVASLGATAADPEGRLAGRLSIGLIVFGVIFFFRGAQQRWPRD